MKIGACDENKISFSSLYVSWPSVNTKKTSHVDEGEVDSGKKMDRKIE
jgi:hypothetical protein